MTVKAKLTSQTVMYVIRICFYEGSHSACKAVGEFLDKVIPGPALAPSANDDQLATTITQLVHSETVNPTFLLAAATDGEELARKANNSQLLQYMTARETAFTELLERGSESTAFKEGMGMEQMWAKKKEINQFGLIVYRSVEKPELTEIDERYRQQFFSLSRKTLGEGLKSTLNELENHIRGPFCLGAQLSLVDAHVAAWLTRVVVVSGGTIEGVDKLVSNDFKLGAKVKGLWTAITERASWRQVYEKGMF
ncbi:hypothetical protein HGRIS_005199 [Hohenbuehelia grisea]|uniref:Glutathione S-transferase n=1 Tax=Hohenbuehelia grisea TaxID=104357 RepID=A0ABR3JF56_9AGAR